MADFSNCDYSTFVRSGDEYDFRIDRFLDKLHEHDNYRMAKSQALVIKEYFSCNET